MPQVTREASGHHMVVQEGELGRVGRVSVVKGEGKGFLAWLLGLGRSEWTRGKAGSVSGSSFSAENGSGNLV